MWGTARGLSGVLSIYYGHTRTRVSATENEPRRLSDIKWVVTQATSVVQSSSKEMSRNEHEAKWGKREASVETNVQGESRS